MQFIHTSRSSVTPGQSIRKTLINYLCGRLAKLPCRAVRYTEWMQLISIRCIYHNLNIFQYMFQFLHSVCTAQYSAQAINQGFPGKTSVKSILLAFTIVAVSGVSGASAADSLLYFEVQGIAGYSSMDDGVVYHSGHRHDVMQKNGIGFDYIKKLSGEYGDWGTGALQMRLAWNDSDNRPQLQIYNAWLKLKTSLADVWVGHNRVPYGLAAWLDTHAELLHLLSMSGFGFDRDWGAGINRDFTKGDFAAAVTTGSGMGLKTKGNWIVASRASYGVLSQDNYNFGVSFMGGKMLDTMGYELMDDNPKDTLLGGVDFAWNYYRVEHKAEFDFGQKNEKAAVAALYRLGYNFLEENRLKLEGQYTWTKREGTNDAVFGFGATYKVNSNLTARAMYQWDREMSDNRVVFQLYYYRLFRR